MSAIATQFQNDTVSPEHRRGLRDAIQAYRDGDSATAAFLEAMLSFDESPDRAVREIAFDLWFIYMDSTGKKFCADKNTWDRIQRALLLLDSGEPYPETGTTGGRAWRWSGMQFVAGALLAATLFLWAFKFPLNGMGLVVSTAAALLLCRWRATRSRREEIAAGVPFPEEALAPFPDLPSLRRCLKQNPMFGKTPCPARFRDPNKLPLYWRFMFFICFALLSPLVLLLHCFPYRIAVKPSAKGVPCA